MPPITKTTIHSSCNCKKVVIEIQLREHQNANGNKADNDVINCHCSFCRKYHTSGFTSFLTLDKKDVSVRRGIKKIGIFLSECEELGGPVERWFCTECSSKLLSMPLSSDDIEKDSRDRIKKDGEKTTTTICYVNLGPMQDDDQQEVNNLAGPINPLERTVGTGRK